MEQKTQYRVSMFLTGPVRITETLNDGFFSSEGKPKVFCAPKVVNDTFFTPSQWAGPRF